MRHRRLSMLQWRNRLPGPMCVNKANYLLFIAAQLLLEIRCNTILGQLQDCNHPLQHCFKYFELLELLCLWLLRKRIMLENNNKSKHNNKITTESKRIIYKSNC